MIFFLIGAIASKPVLMISSRVLTLSLHEIWLLTSSSTFTSSRYCLNARWNTTNSTYNSDGIQLTVPLITGTFQHACAKCFNRLSKNIRNCASHEQFSRLTKTFLMELANDRRFQLTTAQEANIIFLCICIYWISLTICIFLRTNSNLLETSGGARGGGKVGANAPPKLFFDPPFCPPSKKCISH